MRRMKFTSNVYNSVLCTRNALRKRMFVLITLIMPVQNKSFLKNKVVNSIRNAQNKVVNSIRNSRGTAARYTIRPFFRQGEIYWISHLSPPPTRHSKHLGPDIFNVPQVYYWTLQCLVGGGIRTHVAPVSSSHQPVSFV